MAIKEERKIVIGDKLHFFNRDIISLGTVIGFKRDTIYVEVEDNGAKRIKKTDIIDRDRYK